MFGNPSPSRPLSLITSAQVSKPTRAPTAQANLRPNNPPLDRGHTKPSECPIYPAVKPRALTLVPFTHGLLPPPPPPRPHSSTTGNLRHTATLPRRIFLSSFFHAPHRSSPTSIFPPPRPGKHCHPLSARLIRQGEGVAKHGRSSSETAGGI
ncbi:hypothetical protein LY76DRAFT_21866 [Colletotrichum caudatum]|nr:hypothetical protein LY76DRAFT_21866 [Colletotrichum caudatum]